MKKSILLSMMMILISLSVFAESNDNAGPVLPFNDVVADLSVVEPNVPKTFPNKIAFQRPSVGAMIMGGVLGNILGTIAGRCLGAPAFGDDNELPLILYLAVGSALGSATGASIAGYSRDWKGSLGMAMIGAALGAGLSWLLASSSTFQGSAGMLVLVPLLILPPISAAIFYRSSLRPRKVPKTGALLNLSSGRLGLGVPDVRVRPIFAPGCGSKPELQFNVNVLSVEI